jgi:hypothetical protein
MALIEAVNDKADGPKSAIGDGLRTIGKSRPALVLSSIENYLIKHKRVSQEVQLRTLLGYGCWVCRLPLVLF